EHQSGPDTYAWVPVNNADYKKPERMNVDTQNGCTYIDIPITVWKNAEGHDYLISEVTVKAVYYTTTVITKLDEIKADGEAEVKSVTYYNVLGAESDKPFSGVNIVATLYTDGTVKAEKRLFPER
ncbi:MAG: hypothetical protein J6U03_05080, partial [Muribaculaceae bacterium]|nr:hypothetical protein [Muribaculaceae bacterium]